ncbi:MAG TPA: hypothetical protein VNO14_17770 [Blastocatellia bacterium]|nr:hypothetical protein [Blastocatellia bacterium]
MSSNAVERERGFTILEGAVVVMVIGVIVAFAAPKISSAMRDYRLNIALRQINDTLRRAKMQAISESNRTGVAIDVLGKRIGLITYQNDGVTVSRIDYIPLPSDVSFERPPDEGAAPAGVTGEGVLSLALRDGVYVQDFNTRGFPVVASGADVVSIFLGNGRNYLALTMSSVGGVRTYRYENRAWQNTRGPKSADN